MFMLVDILSLRLILQDYRKMIEERNACNSWQKSIRWSAVTHEYMLISFQNSKSKSCIDRSTDCRHSRDR